MKIIYQGKEYQLEDLRREQKQFEQSLEVPEYLKTEQVYDFVCFDPGYKLALGFFNDIYFQIASARFALIMGHKKLHDSNYVSWESGAIGQLWLRTEYLRNSIIWYNSSYDLLWQSVWFGFSLFRKIKLGKPPKQIHDVDSEENFQKLLRSCTYDKLFSALSSVEENEGSDNAKELIKRIQKFNGSEPQKEVREWANSLKHRGSFKVKELYNPSGGLTIGTFNSDYTVPFIVGIDDISDILRKYHVSLCQLIKFTFDFFNFKDMIPEEIEGKIPMDIVVKEENYKKIVIK